MFLLYLGNQYVSISIESSSGPSKKTDPYLEMLKCTVGSQSNKRPTIPESSSRVTGTSYL